MLTERRFNFSSPEERKDLGEVTGAILQETAAFSLDSRVKRWLNRDIPAAGGEHAINNFATYRPFPLEFRTVQELG